MIAARPLRLVLVIVLSAGCAQSPAPAPAPRLPSRTIIHPPTRLVPYTWSEEHLAERPGWHDRLYHEGEEIPGIPPTADSAAEPVVILNGQPL